MSHSLRASGTAFCFLLLCLPLPPAAAAPKAPLAQPDLASDFKFLARQTPWPCATQDPEAVPVNGWDAEPVQCAWQERLQMRRWSGQGGTAPGACVSAQARWWRWARDGGDRAAGVPKGWRMGWHSQSLQDDGSARKRIVIIRGSSDGRWSVTEWRWEPSLRAATRRWQQQRWALLAARAAQLRQPAEPEFGAPPARMARAILESNLGARAGEIGSDIWQWESDRQCLRVEAVGLDRQQVQLPYAADDSRLEQRAAMQLQLARRYPKAMWLTTFRLVPPVPHVKTGAKFYAMWLDQGKLKAQLWIPTRGAGPLVRIRIDTVLPAAPGRMASEAAVARAGRVVERELFALAARWAYAYE